MTLANSNYPKEITLICQALVLIKDEKELQTAYKIHRDAILAATSNFPSNIRIDKRITAIRKNISCICETCGVCHGDYKKPHYCSNKCYSESRQKDSVENDKAKAFKKIQKSIEKYNGIENEDYVECKVCGLRTSGNLTIHLSTVHDMTVDKYKAQYNGKLSPPKNGFRKGEANIAFNHGGKFSPWSDKFVNPNNIDIEECKTRTQQAVLDSDKLNTRMSFYLDQGMTEAEAKIALSERQSTFSLQKCIERYGEVEGIQVFNERQEKWQESLNSKSEDEILEINRKKCYKQGNGSKFESEIFSWLKEKIPELEKQFEILCEETGRWKFYDIRYKNKIIECNGDFWHMNPVKYKAEDTNPYYKNKTAIDVWNADAHKTKIAIKNGFDVMPIWESDYKADKTEMLQKALNFLKT